MKEQIRCPYCHKTKQFVFAEGNVSIYAKFKCKNCLNLIHAKFDNIDQNKSNLILITLVMFCYLKVGKLLRRCIEFIKKND